jgi:hypothetical protein
MARIAGVDSLMPVILVACLAAPTVACAIVDMRGSATRPPSCWPAALKRKVRQLCLMLIQSMSQLPRRVVCW